MQHIDCLFSGRRQLLAQTHTDEELARVRRECVSRLVKCNVAQGLDVIVRSLHDGSVMVTDMDKATDKEFLGSNWISGITCYVYQIQVGTSLPRGTALTSSWRTSI
jgi:dedicator of cytokinesis protein 3